MSNFEVEAMNKFTGTLPSTYRRYVDDTFLIFKDKTDGDSFFKHINNSHPNIKFTMKTEHNKTLPFLDILVIRQSDGTLTNKSTANLLKLAFTLDRTVLFQSSTK